MPSGRTRDAAADGDGVPPSFGQRLSAVFLRPVEPAAADQASDELTVEELQTAVRVASDKERLVGLVAAPLAAAISFLVLTTLIDHDPPSLLKNGQVNHLHVSISLYHNLELVLLGMSVLMLVAAMLRKRMFLGIFAALYGLAIFNLHYWGFGVPFVMVGAWLLVRAYRLQRELREATGEAPQRPPRTPSANKRFTLKR